MRDTRIKGLFAAMMATLATISVAAQTDPKPKTETRVESKAIPFQTNYEVSRDVPAGRLKKEKPGKPGEVINTYTVTFKDGKPVGKTLVSSQRVEPVDEVMLIGKAGIETSRHMFSRRRVLNMNASAYDASSAGGNRTATGLPANFGVVAVDPAVIPLGSFLFIEGYGLAVAADKGSAIKGNRIDLCFGSRSTAVQFGRHTVKVHVLRGK